jgi:SAM-dependent methyltransferase
MTRWPPVGKVNFHNLRQLSPISRSWGGDRGTPVDRFYIEQFLARHAGDVEGHVLEIGGNLYTKKFGKGKVTHSDVLHAVPGNPLATIVADLSHAPHIPDNAFDCILCTQTLQFIPEVDAAVSTLYRILRPGGVLLASSATISPLDLDEKNQWGDYWRFTSQGFSHLFQRVFTLGNIQVAAYGNVLAAIAFLHGLAAEELNPHELEHRDPAYELVVLARLVKGLEKP